MLEVYSSKIAHTDTCTHSHTHAQSRTQRLLANSSIIFSFNYLIFQSILLVCSDSVVVRALGSKSPGCGFESGSYLCLWDLFAYTVTPWSYVPSVTSPKAEQINSTTITTIHPNIEMKFGIDGVNVRCL